MLKDALLVSPESAGAILSGEQTSVVGIRPASPGECLLATEDGKVLGRVSVGKAAPLDKWSFSSSFSAHRMTDQARQLRWPRAKRFHVHDVTVVERFDEPRTCVAKQRRDVLVVQVEDDDSGFPYVLTAQAVAKGDMPESGSGLTGSLEAVVPVHLRYWEYDGAEAVAVRDELYKREIITPDTVREVGGELRVVVVREELFEPPEIEEIQYAVGWHVEKRHPLTEQWHLMLEADGGVWSFVGKSDPAVGRVDGVELQQLADQGCLTYDGDTAGGFVRIVAKGAARVAEENDDGFVVVFDDGPLAGVYEFQHGADEAWSIGPRVLVDDKPERPRLIKKLFDGSNVVVPVTFKDEQDTDEHIITGVVLEPNDGSDGRQAAPDADSDVYNAEEIRLAQHWFMEHGVGIGLMHEIVLSGQAAILESFLAPVDYTTTDANGNEVLVKKGSWILTLRILDSDLWAKIKNGELNAFSIGGDAIRILLAA